MTEIPRAEAADRPRGQWPRMILYGIILAVVVAG